MRILDKKRNLIAEVEEKILGGKNIFFLSDSNDEVILLDKGKEDTILSACEKCLLTFGYKDNEVILEADNQRDLMLLQWHTEEMFFYDKTRVFNSSNRVYFKRYSNETLSKQQANRHTRENRRRISIKKDN